MWCAPCPEDIGVLESPERKVTRAAPIRKIVKGTLSPRRLQLSAKLCVSKQLPVQMP